MASQDMASQDMADDSKRERDAITGQMTTGHEWDGVKELNAPLPRWWLNIFYATIIWSLGYFVVYPSWPMLTSHLPGVIGYSSRAEVSAEIEEQRARRATQIADLGKVELAAIKADPKLFNLALAQGKAAFGDNCAPCHGIGGAGSKGYPNLNDDEWLWGGALDDIHMTLKNGIRSSNNAETRLSVMPAFGRDGLLKRDEIRAVSNHVRRLASLPTEQGFNAAQGEKVFAESCAACHGEKGLGNKELGAPNLTDAIWLYGSDIDSIIESVSNSRAGVMPAWSGRLDPVTIKALAVYVHSLGGGK